MQVFTNDFPALLTDPLPFLPEPPTDAAPGITEMFASQPVRGRCKVICFHPRHDLTLAMMQPEEIEAVVEGWKNVYAEEGKFLAESGNPEGYVQIFEVSNDLPLYRCRTWPSGSSADRSEPGSDDGRFGSSSTWTSMDPILVSLLSYKRDARESSS